jgi:hypothetical protein
VGSEITEHLLDREVLHSRRRLTQLSRGSRRAAAAGRDRARRAGVVAGLRGVAGGPGQVDSVQEGIRGRAQRLASSCDSAHRSAATALPRTSPRIWRDTVVSLGENLAPPLRETLRGGAKARSRRLHRWPPARPRQPPPGSQVPSRKRDRRDTRVIHVSLTSKGRELVYAIVASLVVDALLAGGGGHAIQAR